MLDWGREAKRERERERERGRERSETNGVSQKTVEPINNNHNGRFGGKRASYEIEDAKCKLVNNSVALATQPNEENMVANNK